MGKMPNYENSWVVEDALDKAKQAYQKLSDIENKVDAISTQISSPYNFKGDVPKVADLPTGASINDTYYVTGEGDTSGKPVKCKYTWNGNAWYQSSATSDDLSDDIKSEIGDVKEDLSELNLYALKGKANILSFATKHENQYIPRVTSGKYVVEEKKGYCWYEVDIPKNRSGMLYIRKQTNMTTGQHIIVADDNGNGYVNIGYNTTPTQSYFEVTSGYIGIDFGNLLSRTNYGNATKILIGYTDSDIQECYVVRGKTTDELTDVIFPYMRGAYPFITTADFNDGHYSKTTIRNAITDIKLNVFGYKNPYVSEIYWNVVNESFYILIKATDMIGNVVSICNFIITYPDSGIKKYNSQQITNNGEPVGTIEINVSQISKSEIVTRSMNTHDYHHFGISDKCFSLPCEIIPPYRFYSIAGMTTEWFLKNCLIGDINDYYIRLDESVTAHYNSNFDRRHVFIKPVNESKGGGNVLLKLDSMNHEGEQAVNVVTLRADKNALANRTLKVLMIGDSLIDNSTTVEQMKVLFDADASGARIEFYGTRGTAPCNHEGRAGWSTYDVLHTQSYNDRENAFINPSTGVFDFSYYCTHNSIITLDWVVIQLGVNDAFRPMNDTTTIDNINTMITNIKAYMPNVKIAVATLPQPYLGGAYSNVSFRPPEFDHKFRLNASKDIINTYKGSLSNNIYIAPIHAVVDTDNDFNLSSRPVNADSNITEQYCSDTTHYGTNGHKKVARQYYCMMKYVE